MRYKWHSVKVGMFELAAAQYTQNAVLHHIYQTRRSVKPPFNEHESTYPWSKLDNEITHQTSLMFIKIR